MTSEVISLRGTLKGHNGWVTQIATTPQYPDTILSASRGNYMIEYQFYYTWFCVLSIITTHLLL